MEVAQFDVAIVGGGPAGASAAITAARMRASVVLFDSSDFPRQKVCGEFVSAESLELLRDLVREHPTADEILRKAPSIARARIFAANRSVETAVEPPGVSMSRYDLDLLLWKSAVQAGATAHSRCEVTAIEGDGPFSLKTAQGDLAASAVVVCAGRWSRYSRVSEAANGRKWIGLKAHYGEVNPSPTTDLYFLAQGYCGVQAVAPDVVNVCAMVPSDVATSLPEVFHQSSMLSRRAARWEPMMSPITTSPLIYRTPEPVRGNVLLAGDAAAFIDPFAGDGISLALRSGRLAAQCLGDSIARRASLETSARLYAARYSEQFAPLIAAAARFRSLLSLPAIAQPMAMRLLRLPGVLPYMIRRTRVV